MEKSDLSPNRELNWNKLCRTGGIAAFTIVAIIPVQIIIFAMYPPPETAAGFIELFHNSWMLGLLSLDLLYYINNGLLALVYLGLFASLRYTDFSAMLTAVIIGMVGIGIYYVSAVGFEMLSVSRQYYAAESVETRQQLLSVGTGLIERYKGTAFDVYYVFSAIALLLISATMYKSKDFGKTSATWGTIAGILMTIPSTAGTLGLIFSLASLVPWIVFSVLIGRRLIKMSNMQFA